MQKIGTVNVKDYIRVSRLAQGFDELKSTTAEQQMQVMERWRAYEIDHSKDKMKARRKAEKEEEKEEKKRRDEEEKRKKEEEKRRKKDGEKS